MFFIRQLKLYIIFDCILLIYGSFFDIDEANQAIYSIDISGNPIIMQQEVPMGSIMMVSKFGQAYYCHLPNAGMEKQKLENVDEDFLPHIPSLLSSMEGLPCLTLTRNWWTYEFCHNKNIKQYHIDENTRIRSAESVLGLFDSDFDWSNVDSNDPHRKERFHSQTYVNGSVCDITNQPRSAEVRFICRQDASDHIVSVHEPETCSYRIIVSTARTCQHPWLRSEDKPKPNPIACSPVLEESHYKQYTEEMLQKELAADKIRQQKRMQLLLSQARAKQTAWKAMHINAGKKHRENIRRKLLHNKLRKQFSSKQTNKKIIDSDAENLLKNLLKSRRQFSKSKASSNNNEKQDSILHDLASEFSKLNNFEKSTASKHSQNLNKLLKSQLKSLFKESYDEIQHNENQANLKDIEMEYKNYFKLLDNLINQMTNEINKYNDKFNSGEEKVTDDINIEEKNYNSVSDVIEEFNTAKKSKPSSQTMLNKKTTKQKSQITDPKVKKMFEKEVRHQLNDAGIKKKILKIKLFKSADSDSTTASGSSTYTASDKLAEMLGKRKPSSHSEENQEKLFGIVILSSDEDESSEESKNFTIMSKNYNFQWRPSSSSKDSGSTSSKP